MDSNYTAGEQMRELNTMESEKTETVSSTFFLLSVCGE